MKGASMNVSVSFISLSFSIRTDEHTHLHAADPDFTSWNLHSYRPIGYPSTPLTATQMRRKVEYTFNPMFSLASARKIDDFNADMRQVNQAKTMLRTLREQCSCCLAADNVRQPFHPPDKCPVVIRSHRSDGFGTYRDFKRAFFFDKTISGGVCGFCHVPSMHDLLHGYMNGEPSSCEFPDIIPMLSFGLYFGSASVLKDLVASIPVRERTGVPSIVAASSNGLSEWAKYLSLEAVRARDVLPTVEMEMAQRFLRLKTNSNGDIQT